MEIIYTYMKLDANRDWIAPKDYFWEACVVIDMRGDEITGEGKTKAEAKADLQRAINEMLESNTNRYTRLLRHVTQAK
jgi:hypothetical protein